jgi:predicted metal-dependent phosphoesterase TrpH
MCLAVLAVARKTSLAAYGGQVGRIDLHTHSAASDGTDSPAALVRAAKQAGLDVLGLTDHDTQLGWAQATAAAQDAGIELVLGVEFSARAAGKSVHMLSYLHDPANQALIVQAAKTRRARDIRARTMVERLARDFPISWEQVAQHTADGATVGRPHIADTLVASGVVRDRSEAFRDILHPRGPYYVRHYAPDAVELVGAITAAGGVAVFAHPGANARGRIVDDDVIEAMVDAGLAGLEVYHRDNPAEQRERLSALARKHSLLVTGSSDYHGTGKPNRLGENTTDARTYAEIVERGRMSPLRPHQ